MKIIKSPITRFTINGNSMKPTLNPGQDVLSINWFVKPKVGDIVVVRIDGREMVKRIQNVDDRTIFVVGDNKDESTDSREFGSVRIDQIVGKVIYKSAEVPCLRCGFPVIGIYGRKDAFCRNCGFKFICCGE